MKIQNDEIWKLCGVPFHHFEVSNKGQIRNAKSKRIRKLVIYGGYYSFSIVDAAGKAHTGRVHRLVAEAFCDGYFDGCVVNHKDGNKLNNCAENLEFCTNKENADHWAGNISQVSQACAVFEERSYWPFALFKSKSELMRWLGYLPTSSSIIKNGYLTDKGGAKLRVRCISRAKFIQLMDMVNHGWMLKSAWVEVESTFDM